MLQLRHAYGHRFYHVKRHIRMWHIRVLLSAAFFSENGEKNHTGNFDIVNTPS